MAVNINIPKPVIDYNDLDNKPNLVTEHSELILDDGTNPHGTTASDVGALPMPNGTTSQYIRGDGSLETFPTIPNPANFVAKADYTSHSILAKQSGGSDPVAVSIGTNEILGRKSGGGSNIEGLSVSEVKSLLNYTASDVGAPSGSGTSTGTNTGDETQASILAKLDYNSIQDFGVVNVTGVTTETIVKSLPLWNLSNNSILRIYNLKVSKSNVSQCIVRIYLSNIDNNISGAVLIASSTNTFVNTQRYLDMQRTFNIVSGNIEGLSNNTGIINDSVVNVNAIQSQSLPSGALYLIITLQNSSISESASIFSICYKNF